ncbi:MAG: hypothetical protein AAB490_06605 [Patescibacteria group bacterium]
MTLLEFISITFEFAGGTMVAFTAVMVHHRFLSEHRVDNKVFSMMKREQKVGVFGIIFLTIGYLLRIAVFLTA